MYYTYSDYLKNKYHEKVYKLPVNLPVTCPNPVSYTHLKLPLVLISGSELIYGGIICFCGYILKGDFSFGTYLIHIILPELVYTILATLIVYQIILHINKKLEAEEQRSASRFV